MLDEEQLQAVEKSLREAIAQETARLDRLRQKVRKLEVTELGYRQCYAVAPVATDGGENNLALEPMNVEIIRVVDSAGKVYFEGFIPLSSDPEELGERLFTSVPVLGNLIQVLGLSDWRELSYLYFSESDLHSEDVRQAVSETRRFVKVLRDILEWAALVQLAFGHSHPTFLLIRDGLLRTKFVKSDMVDRLSDAFRCAHSSRGTMVVGVAKHSKALDYLSLALRLEGVFDRETACFTEVPLDLEKEAYTWSHTWTERQCFGRLHLVKLVEGRDAPILPVDIPEWLRYRRKEVLEYLAETARASFPVPGYPYPLVEAHKHARISSLEMEIISNLMSRYLIESADLRDKEKILRHITIDRGLIKGGVRRGEE
jgi:hypothetical protein